jgi:hypothetical protein
LTGKVIFRTIKAGRRKLSRKKSGKTLTRSGELPIHISDSAIRNRAGLGMSLKTRHFFPLVSGPQGLTET